MRALVVAGAIALAIGTASTQVKAQEELAIQDTLVIQKITRSPAQYENAQVVVRGVVDRFVENPNPVATGPTRFFYVKDPWGFALLVRTTASSPNLQVVYRIRGTISMMKGVPYLVEEARTVEQLDQARTLRTAEKDTQVVAKGAVAGPGQPNPEPSTDSSAKAKTGEGAASKGKGLSSVVGGVPLWAWLLISVSALVLVGAVVWSSRRKTPSAAFRPTPSRPLAEAPRPAEAAPSVAEPSAARQPIPQGQVVEDRTVRFFTPPPGTIKLLRGQFDVEGPEKNTIRIFALPGEEGRTEVTFGRQEGQPYRHIQLKVASVSRIQARVRISDGHYEMMNESQTNPTRINGKAIAAWTPLNEGDKVEMGEATFVFHDA